MHVRDGVDADRVAAYAIRQHEREATHDTTANAEVLWEVLQEPDLRDYQDLPDLGLAQFQRAFASRPWRLEPGANGRFEWLVHFQDGVPASPLGWVSLRIAERTRSAGEKIPSM